MRAGRLPMLDPRWLAALILLAIWAFRSGQSLLATATGYALLLALLMLWMRRVALRGVGYRRELAHDRASCGDEIELRVQISNDKLWPLAYLEVEDQLPRHVSLLDGTVRRARDSLLPSLVMRRAMLPYERVTRRLRVRCDRRGVHHFGPAQCRAGDFLSEPTEHRGVPEELELLVLPKIFPIVVREDPASPVLGPLRARRALLVDPLRVVGARDYQSGDPMRHVDWRATARRNALTVRELEPSATPGLQLILDFEVRAARADTVEPDELELAISVVASLATHAARQGWAFGLLGNGWSGGAPLHVPASPAPTQLTRVLEALARARSRPSAPLATWLSEQSARDLTRGASALAVVTCHVHAGLRAALTGLRRRGMHVFLVQVGGEDGADGALGFPLRRVAYEEGWVTRDALVLA